MRAVRSGAAVPLFRLRRPGAGRGRAARTSAAGGELGPATGAQDDLPQSGVLRPEVGGGADQEPRATRDRDGAAAGGGAAAAATAPAGAEPDGAGPVQPTERQGL